jgi:hypothetical protein
MAGKKVGFIWIYGLIVLFATGIIELLIMPAIQFKLAPALIDTATRTLPPADVVAFTGQVNSTIGFMHAAMYVVMFVVFVYMILSIFLREENEYYQP